MSILINVGANSDFGEDGEWNPEASARTSELARYLEPSEEDGAVDQRRLEAIRRNAVPRREEELNAVVAEFDAEPEPAAAPQIEVSGDMIFETLKEKQEFTKELDELFQLALEGYEPPRRAFIDAANTVTNDGKNIYDLALGNDYKDPLWADKAETYRQLFKNNGVNWRDNRFKFLKSIVSTAVKWTSFKPKKTDMAKVIFVPPKPKPRPNRKRVEQATYCQCPCGCTCEFRPGNKDDNKVLIISDPPEELSVFIDQKFRVCGPCYTNARRHGYSFCDRLIKNPEATCAGNQAPRDPDKVREAAQKQSKTWASKSKRPHADIGAVAKALAEEIVSKMSLDGGAALPRTP